CRYEHGFLSHARGTSAPTDLGPIQELLKRRRAPWRLNPSWPPSAPRLHRCPVERTLPVLQQQLGGQLQSGQREGRVSAQPIPPFDFSNPYLSNQARQGRKQPCRERRLPDRSQELEPTLPSRHLRRQAVARNARQPFARLYSGL